MKYHIKRRLRKKAKAYMMKDTASRIVKADEILYKRRLMKAGSAYIMKDTASRIVES
jgi:predicted SprT family Zn-dependent metalloprotease